MKIFPKWLMGVIAFVAPVSLANAADPTPIEAAPVAAPDTAIVAPAVSTIGVITPVATMPVSTCCSYDNCSYDNRCCDKSGSGFFSGAGIYWIQPFFTSNPAYRVGTGNTPDAVAVPQQGGAATAASRTASTNAQTDISHQMDVAPELWLGYMSESGLGFRLRWWYFREGSDQTLALPGTADTSGTSVSTAGEGLFISTFDGPSSLSVTSKLQVQVWDLDILQDLRTGSWDFLLFGGVRFADITQNYNAYSKQLLADGEIFSQALNSGHSLNGFGPTFGLEVHRSIGEGLGIYSNLRGAVLFGSASASATIATSSTTLFGTGSVNVSGAHNDEVIAIGEFEIGAEFQRQMSSRSTFFLQLGLNGQIWGNCGNASDTVGDSGPASSESFGFLGLAFRAGINF